MITLHCSRWKDERHFPAVRDALLRGRAAVMAA